MKHLGLKFHEMSTPSWFDKDPELAWGFFGHRYGLYAATEAHDGFRILREWGERCPDKYFVFTSNVSLREPQLTFSLYRTNINILFALCV